MAKIIKNKAGAALIETTITMGLFIAIIFACLDLVRYGYNNAIAQTAVQGALEEAMINPLVFDDEPLNVRIATRLALRKGLALKHFEAQGIKADFASADFADPNNKIFYGLTHIPPTTVTPPGKNSGCRAVAQFVTPTAIDEIKRPILISCVQFPMSMFFGMINANISAYAIGRSE